MRVKNIGIYPQVRFGDNNLHKGLFEKTYNYEKSIKLDPNSHSIEEATEIRDTYNQQIKNGEILSSNAKNILGLLRNTLREQKKDLVNKLSLNEEITDQCKSLFC